METSLRYRSDKRGLNLFAREKFKTDDNFVMRVAGELDTSANQLEYDCYLRKYVVNAGGVRRGPGLRRLAADQSRFRLGAGVAVRSESQDDLILQAVAKKGFHLNPDADRSETWLKGRATAEYNIGTAQMDTFASVRLTQKLFDFTDKQDLKISLGIDARMDQTGNVKQQPYFQIRENNWALTKRNGSMLLTYDL